MSRLGDGVGTDNEWELTVNSSSTACTAAREASCERRVRCSHRCVASNGEVHIGHTDGAVNGRRSLGDAKDN
jgi:hypothetical protein